MSTTRPISSDNHKSVLAMIVDTHGPIKMGELYPHYENAIEIPQSKRTVRKHLRELHERGRITARGSKKGRKYHPIERGPRQ